MQSTKILTRNISTSLNRGGRGRLRVMNSTPEPPPPTHNPSTDSDELAYRLCELSLQKMQKEARALDPDLRHVLACNSMQRMAQQDLSHRLETLKTTVGVQTLPLLLGVEEGLGFEDDMWDMGSLEVTIDELERTRRKSEIARVLCFQQIKEM